MYVQENYSDCYICYFAFWQEFWVEIKNKHDKYVTKTKFWLYNAIKLGKELFVKNQLTATFLDSYVIDNIREKRIYKKKFKQFQINAM